MRSDLNILGEDRVRDSRGKWNNGFIVLQNIFQWKTKINWNRLEIKIVDLLQNIVREKI